MALLILAAIVGVPVSAAAYFFLALVSKLQGWVFTSLPKGLGFQSEPVWWPILPLVLAGLLVGLTIRYLPGTRWALTRRRVQGGRRRSSPYRTARHRAGGIHDLEPGRGPRA